MAVTFCAAGRLIFIKLVCLEKWSISEESPSVKGMEKYMDVSDLRRNRFAKRREVDVIVGRGGTTGGLRQIGIAAARCRLRATPC
jgi:hypothetical protein